MITNLSSNLIGMEVIATEDYEDAPIKGKKGVIRNLGKPDVFDSDSYALAIEFYEPFFSSHSCNGILQSKNGWFVSQKYLDLTLTEPVHDPRPAVLPDSLNDGDELLNSYFRRFH